MFSQTAEYALRSIVWLASAPDAPQTTHQIADATSVPVGYLYKVLQALSRAGLVRSQRGLHGGHVLRREPADISVLDVINAVDPIQRIERCPLGLAHKNGHTTKLCPLHRRLDEAIALIEQAFADCTVDTLIQDTEDLPMCGELTDQLQR